ncbi:MAG: hypothetical protein OQK29_01395 [Ignavibacteriaceae bacterium]|nr:hypothetical protein [Ignavibacteriaceae bacterium]
MIKIKCDSKSGSPCITRLVEVTNESGEEINNINAIKISLLPDDVVRAEVDIDIGKLDLDCLEEMTYIDRDGNRYKRL